MIRKRLDYWTFALGSEVSKEDRKQPIGAEAYFVHQVEYAGISSSRRIIRSGNYLERSCELGFGG